MTSSSPNAHRGPMLDRVHPAIKLLLVALCLYLFMVGIGSMGVAFKLLGKDQSKALLSESSPFVALFIGILATTLVQSSSTTTSAVVAAVASGGLSFDSGIYMVMGANVGTTVTNTIVSLGHITRSGEYQRAFAAATVHDFFNMFVLLIMFPLELATGFLTTLSDVLTDGFSAVGGGSFASPLNIVTKPAISAIKDLCQGNAIAVLIAGLLLLFGMLVSLVKVLRSLMVHRIENLFDGFLFKTPRRALGFGIALTVLVQSSSITTSLAIPLVGAGLLTIRQVFPYTMGANIGTTCTALLASLGGLAAAHGHADGAANSPESAEAIRLGLVGVSLAFHHVLFNVLGVALIYPIQRVREIPIRLAESFARMAVWNRTIPLIYIILTFYVLPFLIVLFGA